MIYIFRKSLLKRVHGAWRKYAPTGVLVMATGAMWVALPATAQDTVPETPAELRDFRLDTPPAPAAKVPESAPPPVNPQAQAAQSATPPSTIKPRPKAVPTVKTPTAKRLPDATAATTITPDAPATTAPSLSDPAASDAPILPANGAPDWLATAIRLWPLLAICLAIVLGWFVIRFWRNRGRGMFAKGDDAAEHKAAIPAQNSATGPAAPANTQPSLNASFEPSSARLSLANLTVTGRLRIYYNGTKPLQSLRLRNQVISACEGQWAMIEAFHQDADAGRVDILGAAQPGEEIILTLELQVPRDALQAYDWRARRFIAPILLLNLTADDPAVPPYHSNCLIGQESEPLSARMRPLPVDRGPKYFGALRFRPIGA
jgi:hypothetical protein